MMRKELDGGGAQRRADAQERVEVDDDEPIMPSLPEGVEPTYESIDLPI